MSADKPMHPLARLALGVAQGVIIALLIGTGTLLLRLDHSVIEIMAQVSEIAHLKDTAADHETRITHLEDEQKTIRERMREYHPTPRQRDDPP